MGEAGNATLFDQLLAKRDEQRARREDARLIVREEAAVLETNRHATMRWYVHPSFDDLIDGNTIVYRYEIPPYGSTGRQHRQGNVVSLVLSGHGYTVVNGVQHQWEAGDVIGLPTLPNGIEFQHVNESDEAAMLITAEPNLFDVLGVDMGVGFEQLEDAPGDPS